MLKINLPFMSVFLILLSLPLANLPFLFTSLYNKGSHILFLFYLVVSGLFLAKNKILIDRNFFIIIVLVILIQNLANLYYVFNLDLIKKYCIFQYYYDSYINLLTKTYFFISLYIIVNKIHDIYTIDKLFKYYAYVVIISVIIAYFIYQIGLVNKPQLIIYDGDRFAAFHYELVYFNMSVLISFFVLFNNIKSKLIKVITFIIVVILLFIITKSNMLSIYIFIVLITYVICNFRFGFYHNLLLLLLLSFILFIYIFITFPELLTYIQIIFPRANIEIYGENYESNGLLTRIAIHYTALKYFLDHLFDVPPGLGVAVYMKDYINPFIENKQIDGSGITRFLSDFLFLGIFVLIILYFKIKKYSKFINRSLFIYVLVINLSIFTLIFHAGYLNFALWGFIFISFRAIYLFKTGRKKC